MGLPRNIRKVVCLYSSLFVLSACAAQKADDDSPIPPNLLYATHASLGTCAFVPTPTETKAGAGVVAALAAGAISQGVNYLGEALTQAGGTKTWEALATRNFQASQRDFPKCIQVARGRFYTNPPDPHPEWIANPASEQHSFWSAKRADVLVNNGLWLANEPDFFFEGIFRSSADGLALTVEPVIALLQKPIGTRFFRFDNARQVGIFAALHPPGTPPTLKTNPAISLFIGRLVPSEPREFRTTGAFEMASTPFEAAWFSLSKSDSVKPLTATMLVTETESASDFVAFLGKVFSNQGTKEVISTALQERLIPAKGEVAQQSQREADTAALNEADTKLAIALSKLRLCAGANENVESAGAGALSAMRDANIKASAAGRPETFTEPMLKQISLTTRDSAIKKKCAEIIASVTQT